MPALGYGNGTDRAREPFKDRLVGVPRIGWPRQQHKDGTGCSPYAVRESFRPPSTATVVASVMALLLGTGRDPTRRTW